MAVVDPYSVAADMLSPWDAAMRLIDGPPRGNWDMLGDERSDYPPDASDKLRWLATDPRSTNLLCDILIGVRSGDIEAAPSLVELGALDPFRMRISRADALAAGSTVKLRSKAEANRLLASLLGERGAYTFERV